MLVSSPCPSGTAGAATAALTRRDGLGRVAVMVAAFHGCTSSLFLLVEVVMLVLPVKGVVDTVDAELEAELEVLEELELESEKEEEAPVDDDDEEVEVEVGVEDVVVGMIGSGLICNYTHKLGPN